MRGRRAVRRMTVSVLATLTALTGVAVTAAPPAEADVLTIQDCLPGVLNVFNLRHSIDLANDESTHPGPDVIKLPKVCRFEIPTSFASTHYALPRITSDITIDGSDSTIFVTTEVPGERRGLADVAEGATLVLKSLLMKNTQGFVDGSFVHNAGTVQLIDSSIGPSGQLTGPAIVNLPSSLVVIKDSEVHDVLYDSTAGRGGVLDNSGSAIMENTELFSNNAVEQPSGAPDTETFVAPAGVRNTGHLEVRDSSFWTRRPTAGNVVLSEAIANSGDLVVTNTEFRGFLHLFGGAIHNTGTLHVDRSSFTDNGARRGRVGAEIDGGKGGAIYNAGIASVENSVFQDNTASVRGGAVYNVLSTELGFSSFTANSSPTGADVSNATPLIPVKLRASIVNSCSGNMLDGGANLTGASGSGCPGTIGNTQLVAVPNPGPGTRGTVLAPAPGSDAVDMVTGPCPATDQRGRARPVGSGCDAGALEDQLPGAPSELHLSMGDNPSNSGEFQLDWSAAVDPDRDPLTYRIYTADFDDRVETLAWTTAGQTAPLRLLEGTHRIRLEAFDGFHTSSTSATQELVVDLTAPTTPSVVVDRAPDYRAGDGIDWYADRLTVSFEGSTDPPLADSSPPSGIARLTPPVDLTDSGRHEVTGTATDGAGNVSGAATASFAVDADRPHVEFARCPDAVLLGSESDLDWEASDDESGLVGASHGPMPVDTTAVGTRTLSTTATDQVGHVNTATCTVHVVYDFEGFLRPLDNPPTTNTASAGAVIPLSFSLGGDQGLGVVDGGYPASAPIPCDGDVRLTAGTPTTATGQALTYAGGRHGRYSYHWQTERSWAGTCRQLVLRLDDGTYHRASFRFR